MLTTIKRNITKIPFLLVLAVASLVSLTAQTLAYAGTNNLSLWSGTSGWNTLWSGTTGTFTLAYGGTVSATTSTTALLLPVIFGACLIIMLLMGVTLAITHSYKAVLIVAIAGMIGILGIIILQGTVLSLFGG